LPYRIIIRNTTNHTYLHFRHRRIQPHQTPPSHHPPPPLLVRPPRPTTPKPHHAALVAQRKGPTTAKETSPLNTPNRDSCRHHFEHVKELPLYSGREYMQCTKCGLQNPLGLFQHWDTERDGTPVFAKYSDSTGPGRNVKKGRSSGPHLQWVKNTTGKIEDIITREEWDKA